MTDSSPNLDYISKNIKDIREKVKNAAEKSGRKPEDINIIAVTKTVSTERMQVAVNEGLIDFGENKVQELLEKYPVFGTSVRWHLIGHLQTNKVKYIIDKVSMIHSLDSLELAEEINKRAARIDKCIEVLVQVNVAREDTKYGIDPDDVVDFLNKIAGLKNIRVRGFMTIAPFEKDPENVRLVFRSLKKIFIDISREKTDNISMNYLSMGMSNDFKVAIEEGANIVRIGTVIFGAR